MYQLLLHTVCRRTSKPQTNKWHHQRSLVFWNIPRFSVSLYTSPQPVLSPEYLPVKVAPLLGTYWYSCETTTRAMAANGQIAVDLSIPFHLNPRLVRSLVYWHVSKLPLKPILCLSPVFKPNKRYIKMQAWKLGAKSNSGKNALFRIPSRQLWPLLVHWSDTRAKSLVLHDNRAVKTRQQK